MIIEYDKDDYKVVYEDNIDTVDYRIIEYATGYYALQVKSKNNKDFFDYIISPRVKEVHKALDGSIGWEQVIACSDLRAIIESIYESDRLQKGEYWELQLSLQTDEQVVEDFSEVITRDEGLNLIEKIENIVEVMKDAQLYSMDEEVDLINEIFRILCWGIITACIFFLIVKLSGG